MKLTRIFLPLIMVLALYACEKQYTCTCTDDQTGEITNVSTYELSRDNAESACSNADAVEEVSCILDD